MGAEEVSEEQHAGASERKWVNRLTSTVNQVLPFGGVDRLVWEKALAHSPDESCSPSALVRHYINKGHKTIDRGEGFAVVEHIVGSLCPKPFATFFSQLQICMKKKGGFYLKRRVVIRTPSHGDIVLRFARSLFSSLLDNLPLPDVLIKWYKKVLSVFYKRDNRLD